MPPKTEEPSKIEKIPGGRGAAQKPKRHGRKIAGAQGIGGPLDLGPLFERSQGSNTETFALLCRSPFLSSQTSSPSLAVLETQ